MPKLVADGVTRAEFDSMVKISSQEKKRRDSMSHSDSESIPVTVEWRDISLHAQTPAGPKTILRGLTGHASPGELVAIMGPSGAGKTSLLNCLAQRSVGFSGEVLLNGEPWQQQFFSILAYMPQDEIFLEQLTPREHLTFMAQLRLHGTTVATQFARVEQVMAEMKLGDVADSLIGDPLSESGLSRNERKRLNYATETLTEPSLLYVDEPTTGLDSVMAASVVGQLKMMAKGSDEHPCRRTVLATIHQPSSEIFNLFDKLYLIVDGRPAFFGRTLDVAPYFGKLGHPMPEGANPADFCMELFVDPANRHAAAARRVALCDAYTTDQMAGDKTNASAAALAQVDKVLVAHFRIQLEVLLRRDLLMRARTPILTKAIILRNAILGLLLGLVLFRFDMDQTYVYTITGAVFFGVAAAVMPTAVGHISTIPIQLPCIIREIRSNSYTPLPFYITKFISDIPLDVAGSFIFSTLLSFMSGMSRNSVFAWLKLWVIFFAAACCGNAIGQWASILAPSSAPFVGLVIVLLVVVPQFLFCGVLILLNQIPSWWSWVSEFGIFRYFLELAMSAQWRSYGEIPCDYLRVNGNEIEVCPFPDGAAVLDFYGLGRPAWISALVIFAWLVTFKFLGYRALTKKCTPPASAFGGPPPDDATAESMPSDDGVNALLVASPKGGGDIESGPLQRRNLLKTSLSWQKIGLTVESGKGKPRSKTLLSGLSGDAFPGELVAVMGGSGSGKSVFLRSLADRQEEGCVSGSILHNGSPRSRATNRNLAFMGQEDSFLAELTVHEHLLFHASLRMDKGISEERRRERVEEVMSALGLSKVKFTLIGEPGGGISGGERRRLSYAAELLQEPSILLLDEVTSGLDSSMAEMVVKTLRVACEDGMTVICTIHQPSARIFRMFDKLLLISAGETAYFGSADKALPHFASLGFLCPTGTDPIQHMMALVATSRDKDGTIKTNEAREAAVVSARVSAASSPKPSLLSSVTPLSSGQGNGHRAQASYDSTLTEQLLVLFRREMTVRRRSKILTKAVIARTLIISFLLSTVYLQVDKGQQGVFSITGALSFIVINHVFTYTIGQAVTMPQVIPTLRRESQANMYSVDMWYISKSVVDLPWDIGTTLILATVTYWAVGFTDDGENYAYFLAMLILVSLLASGFGHFIGTLASVLGKPELAVPLMMLVLFPMFLFAGLLVNFNNCPGYLLWLQYMSIFYYSFCLIAINQWKGYGDIECSEKDAAATGTGQCAFLTGESVLAYFGIDPDDQARNIFVVVAMIVFFRAACTFLLKTKVQRH